MAFEPSTLSPLPESPVAPMHRHDSVFAPRSPFKSQELRDPHHDTEFVGSTRVERLARSPNKQTEGHSFQTGFPKWSENIVSPAKVPLPPSPTRSYLSPPKPTATATAAAAAESSFMMPANLSDSLIGETSMPTMLMDESLDFGIHSVYGHRGLPKKEELGYRQKLDKVVEGSVTPTKVVSKASATPGRTARKASQAAEATVTAPRATEVTDRTTRDTASLRKTPSTSRPAQTFPSSTSHPAVTRCIDAGDVSTLLPFSPARTAHLTRDEHQLLRESLPASEGSSFFLPPPPSSTRRSPRKPNRADMTLDINDLMARMAKPKRPSGTEESFEDLLNGPDPDFDQTMIGNESFLPAGLRPRPTSLVSPIEHTPARIRNAAQAQGAAVRQSPAKAEVPVVKSASRPQAQNSPRRPADSPTRPNFRSTPAIDRIVPSARTPATGASPRRPVPATVGRRVSLSTGALPLPSSASQPKLSTPSIPRSGHVRSGSAAATATILAGAGASDLGRTASKRMTATTASSTGAPPMARTGSSRTLTGADARSKTSPARQSTLGTKTTLAVPRPSHARTGSATSLSGPSTRTVPTTSRLGLPSSASSRPASFRPTSQVPAAKSSLPPTAPRAAKPTLPQPGTGPSARSAITRPSGSTTTSRHFGTDGAGTTNRLSARPGGPTLPSAKSSTAAAVAGKLSMAPSASPAKRDTTASLKSRAASTPAEHVARGLVRPSTKSSIPPVATSRAGTHAPSGTAVPRPPTSRLPTTNAASSKLPSASSRNTANLLALRARIDALSARQGDSRR